MPFVMHGCFFVGGGQKLKSAWNTYINIYCRTFGSDHDGCFYDLVERKHAHRLTSRFGLKILRRLVRLAGCSEWMTGSAGRAKNVDFPAGK